MSVGALEDQVAEAHALGLDLHFALGLHLFEKQLLFERAFAAWTPSAEELARVDASERVHRGGGARSKARRRPMKRAGKKTKAWRAAGRV